MHLNADLQEFLNAICPQMMEAHSDFPEIIFFLANLMESSLKLPLEANERMRPLK